MELHITLVTAAAAALLNIVHMVRCGTLRTREKIFHGDGGNPMLLQRMRAQANFIESAPLVLILLAGIELAGVGSGWLGWVAGAYIVARVLHMLGMDHPGTNPMRFIGTITTMLTLLGLAVIAAITAYGII